MQVEVVNISVNDLQAIINNALEPLARELKETKALTSLLTERPLTTKEVAGLLNTTEQTIRKKANAGKLPYYMLGSEMRFKMNEIQTALIKIK